MPARRTGAATGAPMKPSRGIRGALAALARDRGGACDSGHGLRRWNRIRHTPVRPGGCRGPRFADREASPPENHLPLGRTGCGRMRVHRRTPALPESSAPSIRAPSGPSRARIPREGFIRRPSCSASSCGLPCRGDLACGWPGPAPPTSVCPACGVTAAAARRPEGAGRTKRG